MNKIDLKEKLSLFDEHWRPKIIGTVNDTDIKLAKLKGVFEWHHHESEDEMFLVLKGRLRMQFRDREIILEEGEAIIVPRGTEHRPVADEETHIMLIEPSSTLNTGNVRSGRTVERLDRI